MGFSFVPDPNAAAGLFSAIPSVKISSPYISGSLSLRSAFANPPEQGVSSGPQITDLGVSRGPLMPTGVMGWLKKPVVLIGAALVAAVLVWHFAFRK